MHGDRVLIFQLSFESGDMPMNDFRALCRLHFAVYLETWITTTNLPSYLGT